MAILGVYVRFLGIYVYVRFGSFRSACEPLPTERMIPSKHFPVRRNECLWWNWCFGRLPTGWQNFGRCQHEDASWFVSEFLFLSNKNKHSPKMTWRFRKFSHWMVKSFSKYIIHPNLQANNIGRQLSKTCCSLGTISISNLISTFSFRGNCTFQIAWCFASLRLFLLTP